MGSKKANSLNLKILYDEFADVLYISFGDPRPGIVTEINAGDLIRVDPITMEVVGITIIDFKQRYMTPPTATIEDSAKKIVPKILKEFQA